MKRTRKRFLLSVSLIALTLAQSAMLYAFPISNNQEWWRAKDQLAIKVGSGYETDFHLRQLKKYNRDVRAALWMFESNNHKPKLQDSSYLIGWVTQSDANADSKLSEGDFWWRPARDGVKVELIWVPVLSINYEWHGTAIAILYDWEGNLIDQYVANIVMVMPDRKRYEWVVIYEVPVYEGKSQFPFNWTGTSAKIDPGEPLDWEWLKWDKPNWPNNPAGNIQVDGKVWAGNWQAWFSNVQTWTAGFDKASIWNAETAWGSCATAGCGTTAIDYAYRRFWRN